jgi:hypothetical protein
VTGRLQGALGGGLFDALCDIFALNVFVLQDPWPLTDAFISAFF